MSFEQLVTDRIPENEQQQVLNFLLTRPVKGDLDDLKIALVCLGERAEFEQLDNELIREYLKPIPFVSCIY